MLREAQGNILHKLPVSFLDLSSILIIICSRWRMFRECYPPCIDGKSYNDSLRRKNNHIHQTVSSPSIEWNPQKPVIENPRSEVSRTPSSVEIPAWMTVQSCGGD
jgi:hypothetical protein